jgi:hypothetical protein
MRGAAQLRDARTKLRAIKRDVSWVKHEVNDMTIQMQLVTGQLGRQTKLISTGFILVYCMLGCMLFLMYAIAWTQFMHNYQARSV